MHSLQITSPSHHKSPTVAGGTYTGLEKDSRASHIPTRPHSTHIHGNYNISSYASTLETAGSGSASGTTNDLESNKISPADIPTTATSPVKGAHEPPVEINLTSTVQSSPPDGSAPPNLASAPDSKTTREATDVVEAKESTLLTSSLGVVELRGHHPRKGSEPPPSLQNLFTRDMGSSRRWADRQFSAGDLGNVHLKQHSFDSSHLKSISPQYPKYLSRVKSPSVLDKSAMRLDAVSAAGGGEGGSGEGGGEGEGGRREGKESIHQAPRSNLNSAISSPQVFRPPAAQDSAGGSGQSMVRAQSSQQLKVEPADNEKTQRNKFAKSGSGESALELSMHHLPTSIPEIPYGLKLMKDRELSHSKESLDSSKDAQSGPGLKRTSSRESEKGKEQQQPVFPKVISQGLTKEPTPAVSVSLRDLNKENRERSAPSKDTQTSAEGSVENMQAPLFQQVWPQISTILRDGFQEHFIL